MRAAIPKLRTDLEIMPAVYQGKKALLVRDSLGLIREPVILQGEAMNLLGLIDGKRSVADIQLDVVRLRRGVLVGSDFVEKFVAELDAAFLLESENYIMAKEKLAAEYAEIPVREATHAGQSYPGRKEELSRYIGSLLKEEGDIPGEGADRNFHSILSPHIDLDTGKRVYAQAYNSVKGISPKTIFLLGTGHTLGDSFFSLTEKDFETPLGRVRTDKELVKKLKKDGGEAVSSHDLAHRREHSLEFQLIFLQYLYAAPFSVVPILCGSFGRMLEKARRPSEILAVGNFLVSLRAFLEERGEDVLVVAGVDFSHIGPKFGHRERASSLLLEARKHDMALIEALKEGDVLAFWAESRRVKDMYNVCGFSAMACLLEVVSPCKGHLLDYEFWREEPTQSAVSFAAMGFERRL